MSLNVAKTTKFKKDVERIKKRQKNLTKLKDVLNLLCDGKKLPKQYKDHKLTGNYKNRRECHLEPDWLLIYKLDKNSITFERTGSHSDLFD